MPHIFGNILPFRGRASAAKQRSSRAHRPCVASLEERTLLTTTVPFQTHPTGVNIYKPDLYQLTGKFQPATESNETFELDITINAACTTTVAFDSGTDPGIAANIIIEGGNDATATNLHVLSNHNNSPVLLTAVPEDNGTSYTVFNIEVSWFGQTTPPLGAPYTVDVNVQKQAKASSPVIAMDSATLSANANSVAASYTISGKPLPAAGTIDFYWATGPGIGDTLGSTTRVPTQTAVGSYTASTAISTLGQPPANATYILAVADSPNADPTADVAAVKLAVAPTGSFTAYRPALPVNSHVAASDNIKFHDYPIPESQEDSQGIGIRIDADDNGLAHAAGQADLDLIEVDIHVSQVAPPGFHYVLQAADPRIKVWADQSKKVAVPDSGGAPLTLKATTTPFWVEWAKPKQGSDSLYLLAVRNGTIAATILDSVAFHTFTSEVILFTGETAFDGSSGGGPATFGPTKALFNFWYTHGYDVHIFVPLDSPNGTVFGNGPAYAEVAAAVKYRGITQLAIVGYSHGGGATYSLANTIAAKRLLPKGVALKFTAYIDAVDNTHVLTTTPEGSKPPGAQYLLNIYQTHDGNYGPQHGKFLAAANVNDDRTLKGLTHASIIRNSAVQAEVESSLMKMLKP